MVDTAVRITAIFPSQSGLPADECMSTFHFAAIGEVDVEPIGSFWVTQLQEFYDANTNFATASILGFASADLDSTAFRLEIAPVVIATGDTAPQTLLPWTPTTPANTGDALPSEVALCCTFRTLSPLNPELDPPVATASKRGRVYLGPFDADTADAALSYSRPSGPLIATVAEAAERLASHSNANGGDATAAQGNFCTYSRARRVMIVVDAGWVDNEWDTQRRRGHDATNRLTWDV